MRQDEPLPIKTRLSAIGIARLLITSYFIALGLGQIDGTDVGLLLAPISLHLAEGPLSGVLLVVLASMVLFGVFRSYATVALALLVFWASYLTMMVQHGNTHVAGFWRDVALICGLLLSHGKPASGIAFAPFGFAKRSSSTQRLPDPVSPIEKPSETQARTRQGVGHSPQRPAHPRRVRSELYRQDFEVVRVP